MSPELNVTCDGVCPWFGANGSDKFSYAGWKSILPSGTATNCAARFDNWVGVSLADGLSCVQVERAENTKRVSAGTMRRRCNRESLWRGTGINSFEGPGVKVLRQTEATAEERTETVQNRSHDGILTAVQY